MNDESEKILLNSTSMSEQEREREREAERERGPKRKWTKVKGTCIQGEGLSSLSLVCYMACFQLYYLLILQNINVF